MLNEILWYAANASACAALTSDTESELSSYGIVNFCVITNMLDNVPKVCFPLFQTNWELKCGFKSQAT